MTISQVAATLYTVRASCQTAADLAATVRKLREIGYAAVQLSGLGPIPVEEVARIVAGEGLTVCATHEPAADILDRPQQAIDRLKQLNCSLTAYPYPQGVDFTDARSVASLAARLDAAGAQFRAAGLTLGYHNHGLEFIRFQGATVLDYLFGHTDPKNLVAELDTYWVQFGGGDCVEWCRRLPGRLPFIHLKDYAMTAAHKPVDCEIGQGNLPFRRIIDAAERSGCRWFIVEQDTCPADPFESLRSSYNAIKSNLAA
ncbi:MAG TPA: sugar phosphate isomerase/epimerase [Opitutaceae bacterium]|jgi:sugar phosphate isomerase/epimerase|nr:sugar phosphate isomerase/epimerase [Opitutaceae bacterium]